MGRRSRFLINDPSSDLPSVAIHLSNQPHHGLALRAARWYSFRVYTDSIAMPLEER